MCDDDECRYVFTDHLGTPIRMFDEDGVMAWTATLKPFGEEVAGSEAGIDQPVRFPGQWKDSEDGSYYNWFRRYAASNGQYMSEDQVADKMHVLLYQYSLASPVTMFDAFGLRPDCPRMAEFLPDPASRGWDKAVRKAAASGDALLVCAVKNTLPFSVYIAMVHPNGQFEGQTHPMCMVGNLLGIGLSIPFSWGVLQPLARLLGAR
jgi:RHS repeat-associated protein